jgi:hypothetical protein
MPHYNQNRLAMTIFHSRSVKGVSLTFPAIDLRVDQGCPVMKMLAGFQTSGASILKELLNNKTEQGSFLLFQ